MDASDDGLLGGGDVTVRADPAQVELLVEERDVLVVVTVGSGQADIDDDCRLGGGHCVLQVGVWVWVCVWVLGGEVRAGRLRSSLRSRTPGGRS